MPLTRSRLRLLPLVLALAAPLGALSQETTREKESKEAFDHSEWTRFLKKYVDENGWVAYEKIQATGKKDLKAYLARLARPVKLEKKEDQIAFWINAYNAVTIQKLLDHRLPETVPHATFFGKNIFTEETYRIAGEVRSLDDIEHGILRKKYREPRVHAALVCGASSCPRLRSEAYTGKKLERQLEEEARRWIQEGRDLKGKRKNYLDRGRKTFYVSKIFDWFEEDFGDSEAGILAFVTKHSSDADREFVKKNRVRIRFLDYDWSLNRQGGGK